MAEVDRVFLHPAFGYRTTTAYYFKPALLEVLCIKPAPSVLPFTRIQCPRVIAVKVQAIFVKNGQPVEPGEAELTQLAERYVISVVARSFPATRVTIRRKAQYTKQA